MLSPPRAQVQSLVGELRSHKLGGEGKKKKKVRERDVRMEAEIREKFEDGTLLALKMEEGTASQRMQVTDL